MDTTTDVELTENNLIEEGFGPRILSNRRNENLEKNERVSVQGTVDNVKRQKTFSF